MKRTCLMLAVVAALLAIVSAGHEHRKLLHAQSTPYRAANNLRASTATSEAILRAVDSGARLSNTHRAADVGTAMAWASGQHDQRLFDMLEQTVGRTEPWNKK